MYERSPGNQVILFQIHFIALHLWKSIQPYLETVISYCEILISLLAMRFQIPLSSVEIFVQIKCKPDRQPRSFKDITLDYIESRTFPASCELIIHINLLLISKNQRVEPDLFHIERKNSRGALLYTSRNELCVNYHPDICTWTMISNVTRSGGYLVGINACFSNKPSMPLIMKPFIR